MQHLLATQDDEMSQAVGKAVLWGQGILLEQVNLSG